jgi:hypothetical protein
MRAQPEIAAQVEHYFTRCGDLRAHSLNLIGITYLHRVQFAIRSINYNG